MIPAPTIPRRRTLVVAPPASAATLSPALPIVSPAVLDHHLPVMDVTWDPAEIDDPLQPPEDFLLTKYVEMLGIGEPRLAHAFHVLALPEALPAVFHCAAGKDRTGILAALVLSALG